MKKLIILIISNLLIANVTSDAALTIDGDVTVTINGMFTNLGNVVNEGTLNVEYYCNNDSEDCSDDQIVGTISGSGEFSFSYNLDLEAGANLKSFYAIPEDASVSNVMSSLGDDITGVITEGGACSQIAPGTWVGSQCNIMPEKGYWVITQSAAELTLYNAILTNPAIEYNLNSGANLISFPNFGTVEVKEALPDNIESSVAGVITEGGACSQISPGVWVGSQCSFMSGKGYWVITTDAISFSFEYTTLARTITQINDEKPDGYGYTQSTKQSFYFIESVENIEVGDWLLSFNGDELIGSRQWQGMIIDIPVMGDDGNSYSEGYLQVGQTPQLKLLKDDLLIDLEGDIPSFEDNGMFTAINLTQTVPIPNDFSLSKAYPNPFNPVTTLNFGIPVEAEVFLKVYNLQGREVSSLIDGNMEAGYHSVVWNANSMASGVYFVKMIAGDYMSTQKLMLIK